MTAGLAAMLAGSFGVPAVLLWLGHRLRRRAPRWQGAFWGAVVAHVVAVPLAVAAAMTPPVEWASTDLLRGLLGLWLLLLAPVIGGAIGAALSGRSGRA
ncbi:MAG TPA: hypothetical protein VFZ21_03915 [Gemmatimonadaceae bacterium]|nr:hypothetical protein [Gemmatimonadaceae bacterium]